MLCVNPSFLLTCEPEILLFSSCLFKACISYSYCWTSWLLYCYHRITDFCDSVLVRWEVGLLAELEMAICNRWLNSFKRLFKSTEVWLAVKWEAPSLYLLSILAISYFRNSFYFQSWEITFYCDYRFFLLFTADKVLLLERGDYCFWNYRSKASDFILNFVF